MISKSAHVSPSAKLGRDVKIHPFAFIDDDVVIGDGCEIMPYVSIMKGTEMGKNCKVYQGAIVGADPQDFRWKGEDSKCYVGDNNVIRENVIINRGVLSTGGTRIGDGNFIMAGVHIGHDTELKGHSVLGNDVSIAGDCVVGECSILSSGVILHEKSVVGDWVLVKGGCRISGNVPPYIIMAHNPASYFGVNAVIMKKEGFSDEEIDDVAKAYRHVYQSSTSVFNALRRIKADLPDGRVRQTIVGFIEGAGMKLVAIPRDLE